MNFIPDDANEELLDPKIDFVFKRIFGSREHPLALLDLLNAIFAAQNQPLISEVTVLNPTIEPDWENDKTSILDIRAVTCRGDAINVEMQMLDSGNFIKRTLYYWAELYSDTLHAGHDYHKLKRTITINLLNFNLFSRERLISLYQLQERQDHELLCDLMQVVFIELSKVGGDEQPMHLQQWLKFLKMDNAQEVKSLSEQNPAIGEAYTMLNYLSHDPEERRRYFRRKIALMDMRSGLQTAEEKGKIEGKLQGKIEGEIEVLSRQLRKRFGDLPAWAVEKLNQATDAQLELWCDRVLEAVSVEQVFE